MKTIFLVAFLVLCGVILIAAAEENLSEGFHVQPEVVDAKGKRVIGGTEANWRSRPWLAKNVCKLETGPWFVCGCSSTMITREWAVTAGHCVLGEYSYKIGLMFSDGDVIEIKSMARPSNFVYDYQYKTLTGLVGNSTADIGLQKLAHPIIPCNGKDILEILDYSDSSLTKNIVGVTGSLLGWGATEQDQVYKDPPAAFSSTLQETQDTVIPNAYCQAILTASGIPFVFTDSLFCAAPPGVDITVPPTPAKKFGGICRGDSGGPLTTTTGLWPFRRTRILGFVTDTLSTSQYTPCGNGMDIYTRLTPAYLKWIKSIVRK